MGTHLEHYHTRGHGGVERVAENSAEPPPPQKAGAAIYYWTGDRAADLRGIANDPKAITFRISAF